MIKILDDWHLFSAAFGFLGTCVASFVGLLKYNAVLKNRLEVKKYNLSVAKEKIKSEYESQMIFELQKCISNILPALAEHSRAIQETNIAIKVVGETVALAQIANGEAKKIISQLINQHEEFNTRMSSVQQGGGLLMERLKSIETVVEELKSGNIFVRTKT